MRSDMFSENVADARHRGSFKGLLKTIGESMLFIARPLGCFHVFSSIHLQLGSHVHAIKKPLRDFNASFEVYLSNETSRYSRQR